MFEGMHIEYAATLLGSIAVLLIPIPIGFYIWGKKLRSKSKFNPMMLLKPPVNEGDSETEDDDPDAYMVAAMATRSRAHQGPAETMVDLEKAAGSQGQGVDGSRQS